MKRHSSIVRVLPVTLPEVTKLVRKGENIKMKIEKLREAKAWAWKRVLVAQSCARVGKKVVVGEVTVPPWQQRDHFTQNRAQFLKFKP